jgi:hypothetical protein
MERKSLHRFLVLSVLLTIVMMLSVGARAATVQIISYNIEQTPESGFGCWSHNYTGTMTDTGHTVSGSGNCAVNNPAHVQNYSGGSGTINDGLFDTTHLFIVTCGDPNSPFGCRHDDQGGDIQPVITLYLGGTYTINEIRLLKGNFSFTAITSVTVQIGATEIPVTPMAIGGDSLSVLLDVRGTDLGVLPTNQITLKGFSASFYGSAIDQFGIGEIEVDGTEVVLSPTTKDQCKDDGWKNFAFKNQGQCIKFINTGE